MSPDEQRAADYRAHQRRRVAWERDNARRLAGSISARAAVQLDWQPVIDANRERGHHEHQEDEHRDEHRWSAA